MALAEVPPARGRWRTADERGRERAGTFVHRPPELTLVLSDDGGDAGFRLSSLWSSELERGDDYHRPAGPVVGVEHDGRRCWQVQLVPPDRKRGLLTLVVDDATGLVLRQSNGPWLEEVTGLELGADLTDAELAPAVEALRRRDREQALARLGWQRPVPTPAWFPDRWAYPGGLPDLWLLPSTRGTGSVGRAPLGTPAPVDEWLAEADVHRFERGGWSWAVASEQPLTRELAERVVDEALQA